MPEQPLISAQVRELAARIYADLVVRSTTFAENAVKMTTSAENLARVSFKLAESFQRIEAELNAEHLPKNQDFTVDNEAIARWTKK